MGKIRELVGTSCILFLTDLRGMRKERSLSRLKGEEELIKEGEDEVLVMLA